MGVPEKKFKFQHRFRPKNFPKALESRTDFGLVVLAGGKILIVQDVDKRRPDGSFIWKFPGGGNKKQDGNNPHNTLIREMNEEVPITGGEWRTKWIEQKAILRIFYKKGGTTVSFWIVRPENINESLIGPGEEIRNLKIATFEEINNLINSGCFAGNHGLAFALFREDY